MNKKFKKWKKKVKKNTDFIKRKKKLKNEKNEKMKKIPATRNWYLELKIEISNELSCGVTGNIFPCEIRKKTFFCEFSTIFKISEIYFRLVRKILNGCQKQRFLE